VLAVPFSAGLIAPDAYISTGFITSLPSNSALRTDPKDVDASPATYSGGVGRVGVSVNPKSGSYQFTMGPNLLPVTLAASKGPTLVSPSIPYLGYVLHPTRAICKLLTKEYEYRCFQYSWLAVRLSLLD